MARPPRVTIVGAGPGGLAAALLLRHAGAEVRVLERRDRVGGRCAALEADGFRFDLGPTFFLYPRVLEEIYRSVGRELADEVPMTRLDPQYRVAFGAGGSIDATPDRARMEAEIARISPPDAAAFSRYMDANREKLARFRPILENPFSSHWDLLRPAMLRAASKLNPWLTVGSELQHYFRDPRLVIAFSFQAKYLGMSPFQCPSLFSILAFLEYEYGVHHPRGGCAAVSENMADLAAAMGVEMHLGEPVESLTFSGRRVTGVATPRGVYETDALVINSDFARTMTSLVPDRLRRRWTDRKIAGKRFSCSTYMMYLGIQGRYDNLPHHTIHIAKDYDQNLREIQVDHVLSSDPSFYVQNASVTDPTLAPAGMSTLYVLVPVTHMHEGVDWSVERDRFRGVVLDRLAQVGLADVASRIRYEKIVTPADWDVEHNIHLGATFNLAHTLTQMLPFRPRNRFEDLDGVYLVGGGTHPGSGLPVIFESARITSRLLAGDLGLRPVGGPPTPSRRTVTPLSRREPHEPHERTAAVAPASGGPG